MPYCLRSNAIYKFSWGRCNATYYGETWLNLSVRVGKYSGLSPLTGKKWKSKKSTTIRYNLFFWDYIVSIDDFKILATSDSDFHVKVKESLLTFDIAWWTYLKQRWNVTTSLPIWLIPPMRNYILVIFIIVTVIVLI